MRYLSSFLLLLAPMCLGAQMLDVQPGARIRVRAPALVAGRVDGTVIARSGDSIIVATPSLTQYRLSLASLASVEVYQGRSRSLGALKGALWTAGITVPLVAATELDQSSDVNRGELIVAAAVIYGGTGALIGALIGADSWKSHAIAPRVVASREHVRVGVGLEF